MVPGALSLERIEYEEELEIWAEVHIRAKDILEWTKNCLDKHREVEQDLESGKVPRWHGLQNLKDACDSFKKDQDRMKRLWIRARDATTSSRLEPSCILYATWKGLRDEIVHLLNYLHHAKLASWVKLARYCESVVSWNSHFLAQPPHPKVRTETSEIFRSSMKAASQVSSDKFAEAIASVRAELRRDSTLPHRVLERLERGRNTHEVAGSILNGQSPAHLSATMWRSNGGLALMFIQWDWLDLFVERLRGLNELPDRGLKYCYTNVGYCMGKTPLPGN